MMYLGKDAVGINHFFGLADNDNIQVRWFTLNSDVNDNSTQIANPFGSVDFKNILCINLSASEFDSSKVYGFNYVPGTNNDAGNNRKIAVQNGGLCFGNYYPLLGFTNEYITLRGANGGAYASGTYLIIGWNT